MGQLWSRENKSSSPSESPLDESIPAGAAQVQRKLPFDPRSVSDDVSRTPIQIKDDDDEDEPTPGSGTKLLLSDSGVDEVKVAVEGRLASERGRISSDSMAAYRKADDNMGTSLADPKDDIEYFDIELDDDLDLEDEILELGSEHRHDPIWYRDPHQYVEYIDGLTKQKKEIEKTLFVAEQAKAVDIIVQQLQKKIKEIESNIISRDDWIKARIVKATQ